MLDLRIYQGKITYPIMASLGELVGAIFVVIAPAMQLGPF